MSKYFPLFVDLSQTPILVVGAGKIASRRIGVLRDFSEKITVVAPAAADEVRQLAERGVIRYESRPFAPEDLAGKRIAVIATDDARQNAAIARMAKAQGLLVNVSSDSGLCDFYFPGIAQRENVVVGVTASGQDHHKAAQTRKKIQMLLDCEDTL